ncbi:MAG: IPT/TIG domain-containing protein [Bryobacteraceae bacterium]
MPNSLASDAAGNLYFSESDGTVHRLALAATLPPPNITPGGVVPADGTSSTIESGEWASIYGANLASGTANWAGDFPTSLGGTSVTINGKAAYLSFVSPGQINLQVPSDTAVGAVQVMVTTSSGSATSMVTLAQFAPSLLLLDARHVAAIILRFDGSGAYGGGAYDIVGPTGSSFGYPTVAAKPGDTVQLYGTGFGPTSPGVPAGQAFSGAAQTTNQVSLLINNVSVTPTFAGLSGPGLYQINLTVPAGLGSGDASLQASVGGVQTPSGVVISLR